MPGRQHRTLQRAPRFLLTNDDEWWNDPAVSRLWVIAASLCFGTTGTAQALGPAGTTPPTVGAARVLVGGLLLVLTARLVARIPLRQIVVRGPLAPVLAAGAAVAGYQVCFFAAVDATGVAVGTVVALGSAPALAGLGARWVDGTPLTSAWVAATALAAAGVALLAMAGGGASVDAGGVLLAVGAGASYAAFTLATKRLLAAGHRDEPVMATTFCLGALLLVPVLLTGTSGWLATPGGLALALWLGAVPTALGYLFFARGLRHLTPGETATLTLAEPATATVLGAVVLGETLDLTAAGGIALIVAGLSVLAARPPAAPTPVVTEPA
jgi:DME family drug/metabolite transporter